jgi:RNA polymerase sigma factor (sigma-70 family)
VRRVASVKDNEFEDLVQTSLASVFGALGDGGFLGDYSAPWVVSVARNTAIDELRARSRKRRVFAHEGEGGAHATSGRHLEPDHLTHVRHELRRVDSSLRRLGSRQSTVVYLHDVLGHGLAEIATAIGISVAAAQSRLIRGRRALHKELGAY